MPFASFCKICSKEIKERDPSNNDDSNAYLIAQYLDEIVNKINDHFERVHKMKPNPNPSSLSWNEDFKQVLFRLPQEGYDNLIHPFRGAAVRQFDCDSYNVSVIKNRDYETVINDLKNGLRIDVTLYSYNYADDPDYL